MATYTTYLNLEKPTTSETFNLLKMNQNWDRIDAAFGALDSKSIKSTTISVTTNANGNVDTHIGGIVRAFATDSEHSSNCVAVPYTSAGLVRIFDNTFAPIANASVTLKVYYVTF